MNLMQQYYMQGYLHQSFTDTPVRQELIRVITDIHEGHIRPGFTLEEKYARSKDLRPSVHAYDPVFLNILFDQALPKMLKDVTGFDLHLVHVQLRISYPGESYMDWHRDTHIYNGKVVGNIPPVHKVIVYPDVGAKGDPKLHVIPGSHRRQFGNKYIDVAQTRLLKHATISSSNMHYLMFNTGLFHAVVPEPRETGSWRLIYSFAHDFQVAQFVSEQPLIEAYRQRRV